MNSSSAPDEIDSDWLPEETNKHQDHVIAHTLGTTVLGYFIVDDAVALLLDIGFIWSIYVDAEMGLLPQSVMVAELPLDNETKAQIASDIERLHEEGRTAQGALVHLTPAPVDCLIREVSLYAHDDKRRILIEGEEQSLMIETSLATARIHVRAKREGDPITRL